MDKTLAGIMLNYSLKIQKESNVVIDFIGDESNSLITHLKDEIREAGAHVEVINSDQNLLAGKLKSCQLADIDYMATEAFKRLKKTDVYIMIKSLDGKDSLKNVPSENLQYYLTHYKQHVDHEIVNNTEWLSIRYPNDFMAKKANMSLEDFRSFYFKVCTMDYAKLSKAMDSLVELMEKTDLVRIKGPSTDITFSIKNMPVHKCDGRINLPDGEVYTAPVLDSVNGVIKYNVPSSYQGTHHTNIQLTVKHGQILECKSDNPDALEKVFNTDDGARYFGEFAIGVNPFITKPIQDILFDEKISGSFHFTPGFCYENASNGNKSAVHWDLIQIQTNEWGGGEIYFDNVLVRKNGIFVHEALLKLNPAHLI